MNRLCKERCESVVLGNSLMNQGNAITETAAMYLKYRKSKECHERYQQSDETQNGLHNGTDDAVHNGDIEVLPPSKRRKIGTPNTSNHSNKSDAIKLNLNTNCNFGM